MNRYPYLRVNEKYSKLIAKEAYKLGYWFHASEGKDSFLFYKFNDHDLISINYAPKFKDFLIKYDLE